MAISVKKNSNYMRNLFHLFTESVDPDSFGLFSKYKWTGIRHQQIFFTVYSTNGHGYIVRLQKDNGWILNLGKPSA